MSKTGPGRTAGLIGVMIVVVVIAVLIAVIYYSRVNRAVDPRIREARILYAQYDRLAAEGDYPAIVQLIDSIEGIYNRTGHYRNSYETGVLHNNLAAMQLTIALYPGSVQPDKNPWPGAEPDSLVTMAMENINAAIRIYTGWLQLYGALTNEEIATLIEPEFLPGEWSGSVDAGRIHRARAREIALAVKETDRRLSVCYSNLGVIERTRGNYKEAVMHYEKAVELWDRNLEAENNLNKLLGRPEKRRNIIQKLFPPERDVKE